MAENDNVEEETTSGATAPDDNLSSNNGSGEKKASNVTFPPSPPMSPSRQPTDLFSRRGTRLEGADQRLMGPILRRKKVVSMPLGAGGDFFATNDVGGPHRQLFLAVNQEDGIVTTRQKRNSGGVGLMAVTPMVEKEFEQLAMRRSRQNTPTRRSARERQHSTGAEWLRGVVHRKQISLDLIGPNDFFAVPTEEEMLLEPLPATAEEELEEITDESIPTEEEVKLFFPLRFSPALVKKGHTGGGGHGIGADVDQETAARQAIMDAKTLELEAKIAYLENKLQQQHDVVPSETTVTIKEPEEELLKSTLAEEGPANDDENILVGDVVEPFHDADDGIIRATRSDKIKGAICFALMFALTIVTAAWETHLDKESFLRTPVGMACVTECEGDIETRDFLNGHYHFKDGEVLDMFMHVDANSPAAEAEEHIFADIVGADTGNLKATVKFGDVDEEERKTYEKRVTVDFENPEEAHVINVRTESGGFEVSFTLAAYVLTPLAQYSELIGLLIMIVVYILILIEVIHRTLVAVFGSMVALMFFFVMSGGETESIERIMMHQEWSTLGLLFGMMLIVGELSHTGIFEFCAVRLLVASKGSFIRLVILLCTLTAVASAFLDNVTTMLLVAPVTIDMCSILEVDPRPYLIGEVLLSNIGGTATMIGDPPNIIIGSSFEEIGFVDFVINVLPCIFFFCIPVSLLLVVRIYRHYFSFSEMKALDTAMLKKTYPIYDEPRLMIAGTVTFFVIVMFFLHPVHHKDTAWIALLGAFITIAFTNPHDVQDALRNHVEWDTLLFFAGLFVLVEVVAAMGLLDLIGEGLATFIEGQEEDKQLPIAITLIIWVSAITSAFLDNIPYTATMIPIVQILADSIDTLPLETLAWALSFGACLGGNGTLLGASANIVTSGIATSKGYEISFLNFTYPGMIVMFATVAIANLYMLVVFVWV